MAKAFQLVSRSTGKTVVGRLTVASTFWPRFVGWQFRGRPDCDEGLLIVPCSSVHTCFVRFAMDVIFLDRKASVLAVRRNLRPWRLAFGPRDSHAVVEVMAGSANVQPGEVVRLETTGTGTVAPSAAVFLFE
jgi:uncharacterized membrane protein (UPF0127 family)